ncbi:hypothetical protein [Mycobacterium canetti]|uniref:hypothetical protein n=1 Tax=Mycobacterium canetti TaxID=78331 RepID=UPI001E5C5264|nr:hypothetical protein [Mycobacterium canetti]
MSEARVREIVREELDAAAAVVTGEKALALADRRARHDTSSRARETAAVLFRDALEQARGVFLQLQENAADDAIARRGEDVQYRLALKEAQRKKLLAARLADKFGEESLYILLPLCNSLHRIRQMHQAVAQLYQRRICRAIPSPDEEPRSGLSGYSRVEHDASPSLDGDAASVGETGPRRQDELHPRAGAHLPRAGHPLLGGAR